MESVFHLPLSPFHSPTSNFQRRYVGDSGYVFSTSAKRFTVGQLLRPDCPGLLHGLRRPDAFQLHPRRHLHGRSLHWILRLKRAGSLRLAGDHCPTQLVDPRVDHPPRHAPDLLRRDARRKGRVQTTAGSPSRLGCDHWSDDRHRPGDGQPGSIGRPTAQVPHLNRDAELSARAGHRNQHEDHDRLPLPVAHVRFASVCAQEQVGHGHAGHGLRLRRRPPDGGAD